MPPVEDTTAVCPDCGTRTEKAYSSNLDRCMICLLRAGFAEASEEVQGPMTDRFGPYIIDHREDGKPWELGRGAMGATYRAVDTSLQRPVALKLINTDVANSEARERFIREARLAASLRHPSVATVHHFGIQEETGQCFYAMELLEGETLDERVRRTGPLDVRSVVAIARQITAALVEAEKRGLVHRDLKPANMMVLAADTNETKPEAITVKVIDFGIAKALTETPDARVLTHGGFIGTPAFASPEQLGGNPVDVRSDIYSLGATLWYLLTGHMPFGDRQSGSDHVKAKPDLARVRPPVQQLKAARVPSALISLLLMMLETEPAARPNVRELANRLEKIKLTDRGKKVRRFMLPGGLLASAAAVALSFFYLFGKQASVPLPNALKNSVAVLPFENRSEDKQDAFFADGIQDDVLTSLAKIKDLKVISRASVMSYRDASERDLRKIGKELGVANVLEGSVRRVANRVLVNVQLIDIASDRHVWAERYDRTVADSISLQGELASEIARALQSTLSPEEKARLETKQTDNPDAYVFYLRGREAQTRPENSLEDYLNAESFYKQAVALDPRFVLARARLSFTQALIYQDFDSTDTGRLAEARKNAEEALRLDPNSGYAHLAMAECAHIGQDEATTRREVAAAVRILPNDAFVAMTAAIMQADFGSDEEAAVSFKRATELGPREPNIFYNYSCLLFNHRKESEARAVLDRALALAPQSIFFRNFRTQAEIAWTGDTGRARTILAGLPAGQDPDGRVTAAYCIVALLERNFPEALRLVQAYPGENLPAPGGAGNGRPFPKTLSEGFIRLYAGEPARAYECLDSVRWQFELEVKDNPQSPEARQFLALIYAMMGWKEAALAEASRVIELEAGPGVSPDTRVALAEIYGWAGAVDLALPQLEQGLAQPSGLYLNELRLSPSWDPLRSDPRFQKILAEPEPKTVQ